MHGQGVSAAAHSAQPEPPLTLGALAEQHGLRLAGGAPDLPIRGVCALADGTAECIAYAMGSAQLQALEKTAAAAVIVPEELAAHAPCAVLVTAQPKLAFARIAARFEYRPQAQGVHASAVVHPQAQLAPNVTVGPHAVIGAGCVIGAGTRIGANAVLGDCVTIGADGYIGSNVSIHHYVRMGMAVRIEANSAIGARGFGLVHNGRDWEQIPQLGSVVLGDRVEVGAASTIDRGTLSDTVIGDDVHIDNQVQIGHNCIIGAHTVIAGSCGIAGSCTIGANCMIGGGVGIGDHVHIVDHVSITAASQVPRDITEPGLWSSTFRVLPARQWRRLLVRFGRLNRLEQRLRRVEKASTKHDKQD